MGLPCAQVGKQIQGDSHHVLDQSFLVAMLTVMMMETTLPPQYS